MVDVLNEISAVSARSRPVADGIYLMVYIEGPQRSAKFRAEPNRLIPCCTEALFYVTVNTNILVLFQF